MKRESVLWIALGAAAVLYLLSRTQKGQDVTESIVESIAGAARGIRNNNPGNIRLSATVWAGQVPSASQTDSAFVQFTKPEFGIRAMAKIFNSYIARGVDTIEKMVATYAPAADKNDVAAYAAAVSKDSGIAPNSRVSLVDYPRLIPAFIRHENGSQPYPPSLISYGVSLA